MAHYSMLITASYPDDTALPQPPSPDLADYPDTITLCGTGDLTKVTFRVGDPAMGWCQPSLKRAHVRVISKTTMKEFCDCYSANPDDTGVVVSTDSSVVTMSWFIWSTCARTVRSSCASDEQPSQLGLFAAAAKQTGAIAAELVKMEQGMECLVGLQKEIKSEIAAIHRDLHKGSKDR